MRPGPRRFWLIRKPFAAVAEQVRAGDPHVVVDDLAVLPADVAHGRHGPLDQVAGRVGRHDDRAELHVLLGVGLGLGEHRGERGPRRAGREPLVAVDDPLVAVEVGRRLHAGRVAAGHLGLGQADRRVDVAGDERGQEPLALLVAGVQVEHDRVLHRGRPDGDLPVLGPADDLVEVDEVHERQAAAADLGRMSERPQPTGLGLGLQVGHHAGAAPAGGVAGAPHATRRVLVARLGRLVELDRQAGVGVEAVLALALELGLGLEHHLVDEGLHAGPQLADLVAHPDRLRHGDPPGDCRRAHVRCGRARGLEAAGTRTDRECRLHSRPYRFPPRSSVPPGTSDQYPASVAPPVRPPSIRP